MTLVWSGKAPLQFEPGDGPFSRKQADSGLYRISGDEPGQGRLSALPFVSMLVELFSELIDAKNFVLKSSS